MYLVFALLLFDDELLYLFGADQFLAVENRYSVFVADYYDVEGQIVIELFDPGHRDGHKNVLLKVEAL